MNRQLILTAIIATTSALTLIVSVLAGIPEIVDFYPSALEGILGVIPLSLVSLWGERIGLFLLGLSIGWYMHIKYVSDSSATVESLEGCVEVRNTLWKGRADISDNKVCGINVPNEPLCLDCQSPMNRDEIKPTSGGGVRARNRRALSRTSGGMGKTFLWKCPSSDCGNTVKRDFDREDEAINLFSKHFARIVESENQGLFYRLTG